MLLDENWNLEEAIYQISQIYRPGSLMQGQVRNRQVESWGQLVGRTRALAEFDQALEEHGSLTAFAKANSYSPNSLRELRRFFEDLPDDRGRAAIFSGLKLGDWRLIRRLGQGGNAEVWRARNSRSLIAAIKILKRARGASLKRFINEITILKEISNVPGVLPLIDYYPFEQVGEVDYAWLVLPVAKPVQQVTSLDDTTNITLQGMVQIANTLAELHLQGITHRDIKPDNLYVWEDRWVISDFGIASFPTKEALTVANQKLGPLHYIAPEMLQHADTADARKADVYSLAKTLWVLLTGQNYAPPGEQRCDVPALRVSTWVVFSNPIPIDELLERATRYEPQDRPPMAEFRDTLTSILAEEMRDS